MFRKIIISPIIMLFYIYGFLVLKKNKESDANTFSDDKEWYNFFIKIAKFHLFTKHTKIKYHHLKNIKNNIPLIVSNHESSTDYIPIILGYQKIKNKKNVYIIGKEELKNKKFLGKFINKNVILLLIRNNFRHAIQVFNEAKNIINKKKQPLLIFPQGTRDNLKRKFKPGALKIAYAAACPIQPITIYNKKKYTRIFSKNIIHIYFHKQIPYNNFSHLRTIQESEIIEKLIITKINEFKEKYN